MEVFKGEETVETERLEKAHGGFTKRANGVKDRESYLRRNCGQMIYLSIRFLSIISSIIAIILTTSSPKCLSTACRCFSYSSVMSVREKFGGSQTGPRCPKHPASIANVLSLQAPSQLNS